MPRLSEVCVIALVSLTVGVMIFSWYLAQERAFARCLEAHTFDTCMETFR
jgi:hypothetical protein